METLVIKEKITVYYVQAISFPEGIIKAFEELENIAPNLADREIYGISFQNQTGNITYRAGATEIYNDELKEKNLKIFVIPKGTYAYIDVLNFKEHISQIKSAFEKLLTHKNLDPEGFCLEHYQNEIGCRCMVPLKN